METPLSTQVKNIFEKALAKNQTEIHFEPWGVTYSANFNNGLVFEGIGAHGQALKNAINANQKNYSFTQKSTSSVVGASEKDPYITIKNLKRKD